MDHQYILLLEFADEVCSRGGASNSGENRVM